MDEKPHFRECRISKLIDRAKSSYCRDCTIFPVALSHSLSNPAQVLNKKRTLSQTEKPLNC